MKKKTRFVAEYAASGTTPGAHTHPESDVNSLVADLAGKAPLSHTHTAGDLPSATTGASGVVELATLAETQAGTMTDRATTPAGVKSGVDSYTSLVHTTGAETIAGAKTFSDPVTVAEVSTPSAPSSGFGKVYAKSDGYPYWMGDDGTERPMIEPVSALHLDPAFDTYTGTVPDNWNVFWVNAPATAAIDTSTKHTGTASLKLTISTGNANVMSSVFAVTGGSLVTVSFWAKAQTAGDVLTLNLLCDTTGNGDPNFFDGTSTWAAEPGTTVSLTTTFTKYTASYLVPANQVTARFVFGAQTNDTIWIDETSSSLSIAAQAQVITGEIKMWPLSTAPAGYLLCDGAVNDIADYPVLGALLGSDFGGDGSTTFGVPDMQDRFAIGVSGTKAIGTTGGAATHTHSLSDSAYAQISQGAAITSSRRISGGAVTTWTESFRVVGTDGSESTSAFGTPLRGDTDSGSTLPPYRALNYIIKT